MAALAAAIVLFVTGPRRPAPTTPVDIGNLDRTIRGAFHMHTTRSDGALDKPGVASAAARAGLQFAVFTDHGDATRRPEPPAYIDGVLCLDGVEISTNHGHYIAIDMPAAPYPLGGDADAVAEDVARLGGFGVVAHPGSARVELAWSAWTVPVGGLEWLNADSEWRDESSLRLLRAFIDYLWRPAGSLAELLDRPAETLERWDEMTSASPVVALAGHDAHGGLGAETGSTRGRRVHVPSYESSFRTFALYATLSDRLTGDAAADARALMEALREGRVFTAIDAIATPAAFSFSAAAGGLEVSAGGMLPPGAGAATFDVRAALPAGAAVRLLRNGEVVAVGSGGELRHESSRPGVYRVEVEAPRAPGRPPVPWLVSNPIYWYTEPPAEPGEPDAAPFPILPLMDRDWRVEADRESSGTVTRSERAVELSYRLRDAVEASQFVAFVLDLPAVSGAADTIVFRARAAKPMRVSAQLRFGNDGGLRWRKSVYLDGTDRVITIPLEALRPADRQVTVMPSPTRATSLLFVVDLTNAVAGAEGRLTLSDLALAR
jgi:hypothetical protein